MLNRGRQRDTSQPGSETDRQSTMDPVPREMMGRRGCVGRVEMDGWREVGCCVTWWRELSRSCKTQDLGAVSCRERNQRRGGSGEGTSPLCYLPLLSQVKNRRELRWQLALSDITTLPYLNKQMECECFVCWKSNDCLMQVTIWANFGSTSHVVTLDLLSSQGDFIRLPLYHFLPSFSHVPSSAELSLLFQRCSLKRQIVRTSNEGIVRCNRNKCSPGNDLSCSRLPGGRHAHPRS